jgi:hypothetical protein
MIIEMLSQTNEIMIDMLVIEGNLPTGHKSTVRTGLPTATWRLLNYGIVPTKSRPRRHRHLRQPRSRVPARR